MAPAATAVAFLGLVGCARLDTAAPAAAGAAVGAALDTSVAAMGPDHVLATGQYVLTGGTVVGPRRGWFTEVWARTPAGWRIILDHSS